MVREELKALDNQGLVNLYGMILKELNQRNVIRTYNSPVGDYAEWLCAKVYNLGLEANSQKGYDVFDQSNNIRYQVKSRWFHTTESRRLGVIRNYSDYEFDYLIVIFFGSNFNVTEAYEIPHSVIAKYGKYSNHQNGYIFSITKKVREDEQVKDITSIFRFNE